jgi:hypothetical protein
MLADGRDAVREVPPGRWEPYLSAGPVALVTFSQEAPSLCSQPAG